MKRKVSEEVALIAEEVSHQGAVSSGVPLYILVFHAAVFIHPKSLFAALFKLCVN